MRGSGPVPIGAEPLVRVGRVDPGGLDLDQDLSHRVGQPQIGEAGVYLSETTCSRSSAVRHAHLMCLRGGQGLVGEHEVLGGAVRRDDDTTARHVWQFLCFAKVLQPNESR